MGGKGILAVFVISILSHLTRGDRAVPKNRVLTLISIHSPHARGDFYRAGGSRVSQSYFNPLPSHEGRLIWTRFLRRFKKFQSTPLTRGETRHNLELLKQLGISIHSPHARGDTPTAIACHMSPYISIHSPHARGDPDDGGDARRRAHFNPLPSHEGRPRSSARFGKSSEISIHSPHARGDN